MGHDLRARGEQLQGEGREGGRREVVQRAEGGGMSRRQRGKGIRWAAVVVGPRASVVTASRKTRGPMTGYNCDP